MFLCSKMHEEICYENGECPLCELSNKCEYLASENNDLNIEILDLRNENNNLHNQIGDLSADLEALGNRIK